MTNEYIPFLSKIKEIVKHTETEYTFRMTYVGEVRPVSYTHLDVYKRQLQYLATSDDTASGFAE